MIKREDFCAAALNPDLLGIPYSKLDCQAFVEKVLRDCGVSRNWRGSNHIWREALSWRGSVAECIEQFGEIPKGACLFTVKNDGGEIRRGYRDNDGNAAHIGIYTGANGGARHSTTGGVQDCKAPDSKRWTHVGFLKDVDFSSYLETTAPRPTQIADRIRNCISELGKILEDMEVQNEH